jgi:acetyl esterase/lipase
MRFVFFVVIALSVASSQAAVWRPSPGHAELPLWVAPTALEDAQRTMGLVRLHAAQWHIDPHKIGVLGFSAGGHLVADVSTHWDKRLYPAVDAADTESCRPDFAVALYPGHMTEKTTKEFELNPTVPVSAKTPPTFLLQAVDDPVDESTTRSFTSSL